MKRSYLLAAGILLVVLAFLFHVYLAREPAQPAANTPGLAGETNPGGASSVATDPAGQNPAAPPVPPAPPYSPHLAFSIGTPVASKTGAGPLTIIIGPDWKPVVANVSDIKVSVSSNVTSDSASWPQSVIVLLTMSVAGNVTVDGRTHFTAPSMGSPIEMKASICKVWQDWKVNVLVSGPSGSTVGPSGGWVYSVTGLESNIADKVDNDIHFSFGFGNGTASVAQNTTVSTSFWVVK